MSTITDWIVTLIPFCFNVFRMHLHYIWHPTFNISLPWRHPLHPHPFRCSTLEASTTTTRLQMLFSHNMYYSCASEIILFLTLSTIYINWTKFTLYSWLLWSLVILYIRAPNVLVVPCARNEIYTHTHTIK